MHAKQKIDDYGIVIQIIIILKIEKKINSIRVKNK